MAQLGSLNTGRMRGMIEERMGRIDQRSVITDQDVLLQQYEEDRELRWRADAPGRVDEEEVVYAYVSSAARDVSAWPDPARYQVALVEELDNIIEATLVQASFPLVFPTVGATSNLLRFSFAPHAVVQTVTIPVGTYSGPALALEMMIQMNQLVHAALIPLTFTINYKTGFVVDATGALASGINQFRVAFDDSRQMFRFQFVDSSELPVAAPAFALHLADVATEAAADDVFVALGFNRAAARLAGVSAAGSIRLTNQAAGAFSSGASVDQRYSYSIFGDQAADLSGPCALVLDIPQLNDNDVATLVSASTEFNLGACFGLVYTKSPPHMADKILEINSTSYPVKKTYRGGRSRVRQLSINVRRVDGSLVDFRGAEHCFTLRLTVKRTQPLRAVFAR
jgi:hypothetical protein